MNFDMKIVKLYEDFLGPKPKKLDVKKLKQEYEKTHKKLGRVSKFDDFIKK